MLYILSLITIYTKVKSLVAAHVPLIPTHEGWMVFDFTTSRHVGPDTKSKYRLNQKFKRLIILIPHNMLYTLSKTPIYAMNSIFLSKYIELSSNIPIKPAQNSQDPN